MLDKVDKLIGTPKIVNANQKTRRNNGIVAQLDSSPMNSGNIDNCVMNRYKLLNHYSTHQKSVEIHGPVAHLDTRREVYSRGRCPPVDFTRTGML